MTISPALILGVVLVFYLISSIQILSEYERGVIFRLGKLLPQPKGPGVILVFRPSIGSFVSACGRSSTTCRHRT
jgi:regulator of protease activity HflC (stomatin/prohibitin superfamily)